MHSSNIFYLSALIFLTSVLMVNTQTVLSIDSLTVTGFTVGMIHGDVYSAGAGKADGFGYSLCIDKTYGGRLIVGAPFENNQAGAAYIFNWTQSGLDWQREAKITPTSATAVSTNYFGLGVVMDRNVAIIAGLKKGSNLYRYHVFSRSGTSWIDTGFVQDTKCQAPRGFDMSYRNNILLIMCNEDPAKRRGYVYSNWINSTSAQIQSVPNYDPLFSLNQDSDQFCSLALVQNYAVIGETGYYYTFPAVPAQGGLSHSYSTTKFPGRKTGACVLTASWGNQLVVAAQDQPDTVQVVNATSGATIRQLAYTGKEVRDVAVTDNVIIISGKIDNKGPSMQVSVFNASTYASLWTVGAPNNVSKAEWAMVDGLQNSLVIGAVNLSPQDKPDVSPGRVYYVLNEAQAVTGFYQGLVLPGAPIFNANGSNSGPTVRPCTSDLADLVSNVQTCFNGTWSVGDGGNVTNGGQITIRPGDQVKINGDLVQNITSTIIVILNASDPNSPIVINGSAVLNGTLVVEIVGQPDDGAILPILTSGSIVGQFSNITIVQSGKQCKYEANPKYGGSSLQILTVAGRCSHSNKKAIIIGTASAVGVIVIILIVIIILVVIYVQRNGIHAWRKIIRPSQPRSKAKDDSVPDLAQHASPHSSPVGAHP